MAEMQQNIPLLVCDCSRAQAWADIMDPEPLIGHENTPALNLSNVLMSVASSAEGL